MNILNKTNKGVSLITLVITIIVVIILAAIVLFNKTNVIDEVYLAKFSSEFADYQQAVTDTYLKKYSDDSKNGKLIQKPRTYYEIATGEEIDANDKKTIFGILSGNVLKLSGDNLSGERELLPKAILGTEFYKVSDDTNINGINEKKKYYLDEEAHYITDEGIAFSIPGFRVEEEGETRWYINAQAYYVSDEMLSAKGGAKAPTCFAAGTKVTMADGFLKNIEDVNLNDKVLTFNHESGKYEAQNVNIVYIGNEPKNSFTLHFTNDIALSIIGGHDLFGEEDNRYVFISADNAISFIGKHFYNAIDNRYEKLLSVTYNEEPIDYYCLYTKNNYNCIAGKMLTLPDDVEEYLNFYEFDEKLIVKQDVLAKDVAQYGIYEYSDAMPFTKQEYDEYKGKYANIIIGKGLTTWEKLVEKKKEWSLEG